MAGGLSAAQHVCKYELLILEAFLIDNRIAKESGKASPRKFLFGLPSIFNLKYLKMHRQEPITSP